MSVEVSNRGRLPPGWWAFVIVQVAWLTLAANTPGTFYLKLAWVTLYLALAGLTAWGGTCLATRPEDPLSHRVLAGLTIGFSAVVIVQIALSLVGALSLWWETAVWALLAGGGVCMSRLPRVPCCSSGERGVSAPRSAGMVQLPCEGKREADASRSPVSAVVCAAVVAVTLAGQARGLAGRL